MKTLTCAELGTPTCSHEFKVDSYEELLGQVQDHVASDPMHGPERDAMAKAGPEQLAEWDAKWYAVYDSKPDEAM